MSRDSVLFLMELLDAMRNSQARIAGVAREALREDHEKRSALER